MITELLSLYFDTDAPVCKNEDITVVGASLDEVLRVRCHVTADPGDVSFVWQFNNSGESFEVEKSRFGTANGSTSDLKYTPKSERDYGTLACWGRNAIGNQADPCIFQLVPAGNQLLSVMLTVNSEVISTSPLVLNGYEQSSLTLWDKHRLVAISNEETK
jgi:hypothetical protein